MVRNGRALMFLLIVSWRLVLTVSSSGSGIGSDNVSSRKSNESDRAEAASTTTNDNEQLLRARDEATEESRQLNVVLLSLERALGFMANSASKLNLDAVIGTRIVEGQLDVLLSRLRMTSPGGSGGQSVTSSSARQRLIRRIDDVRRAAGDVSDQATPTIRQKQTRYYNRIGPLIRRAFWTLNIRSRDLNMSAIAEPRVSGEAMRETESDNCLAELFGTTGKTDELCRVTDQCWKLMTQPGYRYYSLTHQVFYLEIGQQFGCFGPEMRPLTEQLNAAFCSSIYVEAKEIADEDFPEHKRDLFMEQAALCGMLGYRQFFCSDWLDIILGWQRDGSGCWGLDHRPVISAIFRERRENRLRETAATDRSARAKREERIFDDGCACHRTAVAIGALAQYVRYVMEAYGHLPDKCPAVVVDI